MKGQASGSQLIVWCVEVGGENDENDPRGGFLPIYECSLPCVLIFMRLRKKNGLGGRCERFPENLWVQLI